MTFGQASEVLELPDHFSAKLICSRVISGVVEGFIKFAIVHIVIIPSSVRVELRRVLRVEDRESSARVLDIPHG